LLQPNAVSHIWLPAPLIRNTPYQKATLTQFTSKGGTAGLTKDKQSALGIVPATYVANVKAALISSSRVALKNYVSLTSEHSGILFVRPPVLPREGAWKCGLRSGMIPGSLPGVFPGSYRCLIGDLSGTYRWLIRGS
jgi:hypothetical protein